MRSDCRNRGAASSLGAPGRSSCALPAPPDAVRVLSRVKQTGSKPCPLDASRAPTSEANCVGGAADTRIPTHLPVASDQVLPRDISLRLSTAARARQIAAAGYLHEGGTPPRRFRTAGSARCRGRRGSRLNRTRRSGSMCPSRSGRSARAACKRCGPRPAPPRTPALPRVPAPVSVPYRAFSPVIDTVSCLKTRCFWAGLRVEPQRGAASRDSPRAPPGVRKQSPAPRYVDRRGWSSSTGRACPGTGTARS